MRYGTQTCVWLVVCACATSAHASYHFTDVQQLIGGVEGNTKAQAIQLRMRQAGQELLRQARIRVWDAQGNNPVQIIAFSHDVSNDAAGDTALITSAEFDGLTDPPAQADYTMSELIPASYLAAGSLTFESAVDGTILWRVSWGGSGYTGSTQTSAVNQPNGQSGPPFSSPLPSTNLSSLLITRAINVIPGGSATDYALTSGPAVFVNNSRQQFTLVDRCLDDPTKAAPGICGCNVPDVDTDSDGRMDCVDPCPNNPTDVSADNCDGSSTGTPAAPAFTGCGLGTFEAVSLAGLTLCAARPTRRIRP